MRVTLHIEGEILKGSYPLPFVRSRTTRRKKALTTQSRIIGAVRGAHSQLWETIIPVFSPYAPRKYDKRFGTQATV